MQFEEALKNSNAYKSLAKDADTGNVAHAYMFVSPDETALLSLAKLSGSACVSTSKAHTENHFRFIHLFMRVLLSKFYFALF